MTENRKREILSDYLRSLGSKPCNRHLIPAGKLSPDYRNSRRRVGGQRSDSLLDLRLNPPNTDRFPPPKSTPPERPTSSPNGTETALIQSAVDHFLTPASGAGREERMLRELFSEFHHSEYGSHGSSWETSGLASGRPARGPIAEASTSLDQVTANMLGDIGEAVWLAQRSSRSRSHLVHPTQGLPAVPGRESKIS